MNILPQLLHFCSTRHPSAHSQDLRLSDGERMESSSHSAFIPRQPEAGMDVGIPTCLANMNLDGYLWHGNRNTMGAGFCIMLTKAFALPDKPAPMNWFTIYILGVCVFIY